MIELEILNNALVLAGAEPLRELVNVSSKSGRIAITQKDLARRNLLRQHQWNFALCRKELVAEPVPPTFEYTSKYALPSDFLRLGNIYNDFGEDFRIETGFLLTDMASPLPLVYVRDIEDPSEWDPLFQEAYTYHLASKIVFALNQDMGQASALDQFHTRALLRAKWADSTENSAIRVTADDWVASRYGWTTSKDRFHSFTAIEEPFP